MWQSLKFGKYEPVSGAWYVNRTGKLFKVKMVAFDGEQVATILIEYLDGMRISIDYEAWGVMDLSQHIRDLPQSMGTHS